MKTVPDKKLQLYIPDYLHTEIKIQAAFRGMSIKAYVVRAVLEQMRKDKEVA